MRRENTREKIMVESNVHLDQIKCKYLLQEQCRIKSSPCYKKLPFKTCLIKSHGNVNSNSFYSSTSSVQKNRVMNKPPSAPNTTGFVTVFTGTILLKRSKCSLITSRSHGDDFGCACWVKTCESYHQTPHTGCHYSSREYHPVG